MNRTTALVEAVRGLDQGSTLIWFGGLRGRERGGAAVHGGPVQRAHDAALA